MPRIPRTRLWALVALLLASAVVTGDARAAADGDCEVLDSDGLERDCTFMEELGECAWNALDSYKQCLGEAAEDHEPGSIAYALDATVCELAYYVDLLACGVSSPIEALLK